jgi:hypothetical protein
MNTAQQKTIEKLQQDYVVTVISGNGFDRVKVRASNGISYKFYIIGPRGGKTEQGGGMENGKDILKQIEHEQ